MSTVTRRSASFKIPGYGQNAALQLIVASGTGFIMYHLARVTLIVFGFSADEAINTIIPFTGLSPIAKYPQHFWTLLTYGWVHNGFFEWVSNMLWLYCFGNAVQMLVGYRQVIPLYIYGLLGGGVVCLLAQLVPGNTFYQSFYLVSGQAGVMALVSGALTIAPGYRFYLGEHVSIPLVVVAAIYVCIALFTHTNPSMLTLSAGGLLTGFLTMSALKKGWQPGAWMYRLKGNANNWAAPKEGAFGERAGSRRNKVLDTFRSKSDLNQQRIDDILDKINQRGYNSLTKEEKELLMQASKGEK